MADTVELHPEVEEQFSALPRAAAHTLAEVFEVLELTPGNGDPYNAEKPDAWCPHRPSER